MQSHTYEYENGSAALAGAPDLDAHGSSTSSSSLLERPTSRGFGAGTRAGAAAEDSGADVRERLLKVSAEFFARDGFNRTSVREICRAAKANVASIRYYFGSKLGLYRELLLESVRVAILQNPMPELKEGESGEEGIRRWVAHLINLKLREGFEDEIMCRLISHEMHDPSPALDDVVDLLFAPFHQEMEKAIAKLLGGDIPGCTRRHLSLQLTALCFQYAQRRHVLGRMGFGLPACAVELDDLINYVTKFFIAGARGVV